jgi:hypothetical protein
MPCKQEPFSVGILWSRQRTPGKGGTLTSSALLRSIAVLPNPPEGELTADADLIPPED